MREAFAFQLRKSAVEATEMVYHATGKESPVSYETCKKSWQRFKAGNFNSEDDDRSRTPRKFDDGWREIDRRKSFVRRIGGKKVSRLAVSIRLKQLDLILHLIYVIKSWKKFGKRRER